MSRLALVAMTLALLSAGCRGGETAAPPQSTSTSAPSASASGHLTDLRDIGQLRSLFNTRSGEPRLILLLSPT